MELIKFATPEDVEKWANEEAAKREAVDKVITELKAENERLNKQIKEFAVPTVFGKIDWKTSETNEGGLYRLGMWVNAVRKKDKKTLQEMGTRLYQTASNDNRDVTKADWGTPLTGDSSGTNWSYVIPAYIYQDTIARILMVESQVIPGFTQIPMTNRVVRYPKEGTTVLDFDYVQYDTTEKTEKVPSLTYFDLTAYVFAAVVGIAEELLEDTIVDIMAVFRAQAVEALQNQVEYEAFASSSPCTGVLTMPSGTNTVTMAAGAGFESITYDDLTAMIAQLTKQKYRNNCAFIMHPTVWDALSNTRDGMGRYYWNPDQKVPMMARGYPVLMCDQFPDVSASVPATGFVAFGNLRQIIYGVRLPLEIRMFGDTIYGATYDENILRFRTRFGTVNSQTATWVVLKTAA